jgi:16S rRNA processing protein RimM
MNDAEALAGAALKMPASALAPLPERTYYRHDLVGCDVKDTAGHAIGRVTGVEGPLEQSRLVVESDRGEVLIPMVEGICVKVDPAAKTIVVDPPHGLIEVNERTSDRE